MSNLRIEGNKIFSTATGDLVATIHDGNVQMQPGKNAMTPKVKAFYAACLEQGLPEDAAAAAPVQEAETIPEFSPDPDFEELAEEVNTHLLEDKGFVAFGDAPNRGGTSAPESEKAAAPAKSVEALSVWDIPEAALPEFSPALGVSTPQFKEFVKKNKLSAAQTAELVRRLERRK